MDIESDKDVLSDSMIKMKQTLIEVAITINDLARQAASGNLSVHGDTRKFSGEFMTNLYYYSFFIRLFYTLATLPRIKNMTYIYE